MTAAPATARSKRQTATARIVTAGCFACNGEDPIWTGGNAPGVAARHDDATGHATWCDVSLSVRYGQQAVEDRQIELEDAIAASRLPGPRDLTEKAK